MNFKQLESRVHLVKVCAFSDAQMCVPATYSHSHSLTAEKGNQPFANFWVSSSHQSAMISLLKSAFLIIFRLDFIISSGSLEK